MAPASRSDAFSHWTLSKSTAIFHFLLKTKFIGLFLDKIICFLLSFIRLQSLSTTLQTYLPTSFTHLCICLSVCLFLFWLLVTQTEVFNCLTRSFHVISFWLVQNILQHHTAKSVRPLLMNSLTFLELNIQSAYDNSYQGNQIKATSELDPLTPTINVLILLTSLHIFLIKTVRRIKTSRHFIFVVRFLYAHAMYVWSCRCVCFGFASLCSLIG